MTTSATVLGRPASRAIEAPNPLAGEHARLMRDVARRAAPVLALLDTRAWPHDELGRLTTYLRAAVLRQVSDEEAHLYPHDASAPPFAELNADHVRLHSLTAQLEHARTEPCSRARLHVLVDELLGTLRRHLEDEQKVFAALPTDQCDNAPVLIDVDALPADQATELCIERVLRLRPGQTAELHARCDQLLRPVYRWLHDFDAARFGFALSAAGPDHLLHVTCREVK
jgi:hypothetical protein